MKTLKSILIIIIVLGITVTFLKIVGGKKSVTSNTPSFTNTQRLCYLWSTKAGDKAILNMNINGSNNVVTGEFNWLPAEKDKKTGTFTGTILPIDQNSTLRVINSLWNTQAEGVTNTEELEINLNDTTANPGFGEMKDRGDGVYVYADPTKVDYSLNLSKIDCADSSM
jgi:hypothetical protein